MVLSKIAILALRGLSREKKNQLAKHIGISPDSLYRWIANNDDSLTKAVSLKFIREELGLDDTELLEESEIKV